MFQGDQGIQELLEWGQQHTACLDSKVEIYQDSATGLSFRAVEDLQPGATVATCSYPISLSYLNTISNTRFPNWSEPFPKNFLEALGKDDPNVIGFFFLMQQFLMKEKSFWWPYIRLLPQPNEPDSLIIPALWPEEDRYFLNGTNAEPPIKKRNDLWMSEWRNAISLLENNFTDWREYSHDLYKWAATIFGSRSFRASLVVAEGALESEPEAHNHIKKDRFSLLLPIIDIGNHNGINSVQWIPNKDSGLSFLTQMLVPKGDQIFNFYGDKSNSELLVAYGFMLPRPSNDDLDADSVNLKLKPSPQALQLRRQQTCHIIPTNPEEEFMFRIKKQSSYHGVMELNYFPHDLIDLVLCMVGNQRETRTFLSLTSNWNYCAGRDPHLHASPLYRGSLQLLQILHHKLELEIRRMEESGTKLGVPGNVNQRLAVEYRDRQLAVLQIAIQPITARLNLYFSSSSFCQHPEHLFVNQESQELRMPEENKVEMLSLECAFDWLRINYEDIFTPVVQMISDDQDESLPLNWSVLLEDWDRTYWIVWIYIIITIFNCSDRGSTYGTSDCHRSLQSWVNYVKWAFENQFEDSTISSCIAEDSEIETIDLMLKAVAGLPQIIALRSNQNGFVHPILPADVCLLFYGSFTTNTEKLRNFSSFLVQEETLTVDYVMADKRAVAQKVLCIRRINAHD